MCAGCIWARVVYPVGVSMVLEPASPVSMSIGILCWFCSLWFVVCGLWFVVCDLWFVVLWFVVCGLWFVVCGFQLWSWVC